MENEKIDKPENSREPVKNKPERMASEPKKKSTAGYIVTILILVILLGVLGWKYYELYQEKQKVVVVLKDKVDEKAKLTEEYSQLLNDFELLKSDNESMNAKINEQQEKIKQILEELKKEKNVNANKSFEVTKYQKELGTLRDVMKHFVYEIDSLNTLNQQLSAENVEVKGNYQKATQKNVELQESNKDLSTKVAKASVIKAFNIKATPVNSKGKDVYKVNKVDKIKVNFTLSENSIAKPGYKTVYVRIARPDELVITTPEEDLFTFEGEQIAYTAKREVEYLNKDIDMVIYWTKDLELVPGLYYVDLFVDGSEIGTTTFELK